MSTAFRVIIDSGQEVFPNISTSTATGLGLFIFDSAAVAGNYSFVIQGVDFSGFQTPETVLDNVTNAHFHNAPRGTNGPVVFGQIAPAQDPDDFTVVPNADGSWTVSGRWETTDLLANRPITAFSTILDSAAVGSDVPLYFNVHTVQFSGGAIRGQLVAVADDIDNVVTGTAGDDTRDGGNGNDAILGLAGNDTLNGGNGNDVLDGNNGRDTLNGGNGNDVLDGGADNDVLAGDNGNDMLDGNAGDDTMTGGNGNDTMNGGLGNDTMDGGNGNDTMNGGLGNDTMDGGNGNDAFIFAALFGNDRILGFDADPTGGQDFLDISAFGIASGADFAARVAITGAGADTLVTIDGNAAQTIRLVGIGDTATVTQADFLL
jgi:serralysin